MTIARRRIGKSNRMVRAVALGVVTMVVVGSVFAYTASNTVPATRAGEGASSVSGYTVSNVHYNTNASDPTKIDSVTFDLDTAPAAGSTVKVRLVAGGATWYTCSNVATAVTCATTAPQATVATANELSLVVSQ